MKCESSDGKLKEIETLVGGEPKTITAYDFKANGKSFRMSADAGWGTNLGMFDYIPNLEKYDNKIAGQIAKTLTKSKVFDNYYNKCQSLAAKIEAKAIKNLSKNNLPTNRGNIEKYAINEILRKKYSRPLKELSFDIAVLTKEQQKLLKTTKKTVKLSVETLIKEQIKHNDLNIVDFKAIPDIVTNANLLILEDKTGHLVYYKVKDKYVVLVVKSNKNKTANFITTYHYTDISNIKNKLQEKDITIIFNNLNIKKE